MQYRPSAVQLDSDGKVRLPRGDLLQQRALIIDAMRDQCARPKPQVAESIKNINPRILEMVSKPDSLLNNTALMSTYAQPERKSLAGIDQRQRRLTSELNIPLNFNNQSVIRRGLPALGASASLKKADTSEKRAATDIEASGDFINNSLRTVDRNIWSP